MIRNSILIIALLLAVTTVAAQDAISPFEGASHHYQVEQHDGNTYQWQVYQELVPLVVADVQDYDFLSGESTSSVEMQWLKAGIYYLMVVESDPGGCNNLKVLRIEVIPNNLKFAVGNVESESCYEASGNDFIVALRFQDNAGKPLGQEHFPIDVTFSVDGEQQPSQKISYFKQELEIGSSSYATQSNQNTLVLVSLDEATDSKNIKIRPDQEKSTHEHQIFARPELSFDGDMDELALGSRRSFVVSGEDSWTYSWLLKTPNGKTIALNAQEAKTEEVLLDELGEYQLQVRAKTLNGCDGDWATQTFLVKEGEPELLAVADQATISANQQLVISILENDFGVDERTSVSIPEGTEAGGFLSFNTEDSTVTYYPPQNYTGEDRFTYELCDEQEPANCSQAEVVISVEPGVAEAASPIAVHDINVGWIDQQIEGNVLTNDLFYQGGSFSVEIVTIPDEKAGKLTAFDRQTGAYVFEPAPGYFGEAIFEYRVCKTIESGDALCDDGMVTIQIADYNQTNLPPIGNGDVVITKANQAVSGNFLMNDFDVDGDPISVKGVSQSNLPGSLDWNKNGSFSYTPETDFVGELSFNYQVCDDLGHCSWSTVNIYVLPADLIDGLQVAIDDAVFSVNQEVIEGNLRKNDQGLQSGGTFSRVPGGGPQHGTVAVTSDGHFSYYPALSGDMPYFDRFVYQVCSTQNDGGCSYATAYILVNPVAPLAVIDAEKVELGACQTIVLDGSSSEGQGQLTYAWSPSSFLSDATSPKPSFTPGESAWYYLKVSDLAGRSHTDSVYVEVFDAPQTMLDDQLYVSQPTDVIMLDASESSGEQLTFNWWTEGDALIVSGAQTATPEVSGLGTYYLEVTDRFGCSAVDSVVVGLLLQVDAVNDTLGLLINTFADINVLRNDIPQGQLNPQSVSIVAPPEHGVAIVSSDSMITYTPDQFYAGKDNFVYAVCDFTNHCDEATVLVMINSEPLFVPNAFSPNGDGINDYFEIIGLNQYERVRLRVVNRWGSLVYESLNYGEGEGRDGLWDGIANKGVRTGGGQLPTGTYYYVLDLGDGSEKLTGYIYIDR